MLDVAESVQRGMIDFGYEIAAGGGSFAASTVRRRLAARIPGACPPVGIRRKKPLN